MERTPQPRTIEEIDLEIAKIDKLIIATQEQPFAHFESGSNSESGDQSQETEMDTQALANGPELRVKNLHHQKAELQRERDRLQAQKS